jgi:hypothetical protein
MKRIVSFSLWGDIPRYTIGAIKNAKLAKLFYPGFECWFYVHKETVPDHIIDELIACDNVRVIIRHGNLDELGPMMWRFESIDDPDVEVNISRDTDTRILLREKLAVDEWLNSGKTFHIMRDHPHHMNPNTLIMGGMFGTRKIDSILSWKENIYSSKLNDKGRALYNKDQDFLNTYIYPLIDSDCVIHSSFGPMMNETNVKPFPIPYFKNYLFVGGYVYEDETVSEEHTMILKQACSMSK